MNSQRLHLTPDPKPALSLLQDQDFYLFNEGNHGRLYQKLGAQLVAQDGVPGVHFAVWAPDAEAVSVVGDFNRWDPQANPMHPLRSSGLWGCFVPRLQAGALYKYRIRSRVHGQVLEKSDPLAFACELPPRTASQVWDLRYAWGDQDWMRQRGSRQHLQAPISIYELHLGSWRRRWEAGSRPLSYRELAEELVDYVKGLGFTHVEFLPVMEHPFTGSWGYQVTGYFAATRRYGDPQDLMFLIDRLHQNGIGVILDWVPSHFPNDPHGLGRFDGTALYEHEDPRQGLHPDWDSLIFNYGRNEVRSFLLSSALFWLDRFHADGLRVDAVASMLYLNYSREAGDWIPNRYGGNENLEAIEFLRRLNQLVYREYPDVQTIAEESSAWPMVSRPTHLGGLGFGLKWDMGWMHDSLRYLSKDPVHRKFHHEDLTFRMLYAFQENFCLPLSHDEVVHHKGSLLAKMPGDDWQKFANLRLLLGWMYAQPGKKLLFMGGEFGCWNEWDHDGALDWRLLDYPNHRGVQRWVQDLNGLYRREAACHAWDCDPRGFEWVDCHDAEQSIVSLLRRAPDAPSLMAVANFTPVPRFHYRVGMPSAGVWIEALNSDAREYGGSGLGNLGRIQAEGIPAHGRPASLQMTLPPLSILFFKEG
ncbi:MAG: 1,4-alpha-glucan branching protein GlgB [bacterium]